MACHNSVCDSAYVAATSTVGEQRAVVSRVKLENID